MGLDRRLQVGGLLALVLLQIRVDLPDLGVDPIELLGVGVVKRQYALKDPIGMDPAQGVRNYDIGSSFAMMHPACLVG